MPRKVIICTGPMVLWSAIGMPNYLHSLRKLVRANAHPLSSSDTKNKASSILTTLLTSSSFINIHFNADENCSNC